MFTLKCAAWSWVAADSGVSRGEDIPVQLGKKKKKKFADLKTNLETLMYSLFRAFRLLISQPENTDH